MVSVSEPNFFMLPLTFAGSNSHDMATRNLYLVSRMFWSEDVCRSDVCWGTLSPQFNFTQVFSTFVLYVQYLKNSQCINDLHGSE